MARVAVDAWPERGGTPGTSLLTVVRAAASASGPLSRADIAGRTGLTKATVSTQVDRLLAAGLLREGSPVPRTGAGRPAAGLVLSGDRVAAVGLEVGVDHLAGCVRDLAGVVRHRIVLPGNQRDLPAHEVLTAAAQLAARLRRAAVGEGLSLAGVGVAVPGLVDGLTGRALLAPNLGWVDVDVARAFRRARHADDHVVVENEATLCALAEIGYPAAMSASGVDPAAGFVVVSGEVGVGAGLVVGGELVRGRRGWAGELGHVAVDAQGARCRCGAHGCLEVVAGLEAILLAAGRDASPAARGAPTPVGGLVASALAGEGRTLAALSRAGRALGVALSSAVNLLDVDAVVLGGIYADLAPWLVPAVEPELRVRVLSSRLRPVTVAVSRLGPDAAVLGAAASVLRGVLAAPQRWLSP